MVTELPAATDAALAETRYLVAGPGVVEIAPVVPLMAVLSVAVTECVVVVVTVLNVIVARPDAFVFDVVPGEKVPPLELVQVMVLPAIATLLPLASFSWAVIVTELP